MRNGERIALGNDHGDQLGRFVARIHRLFDPAVAVCAISH